MQNFVVSARKYRPMQWEDVVGQDAVVKTLKNAVKNEHLAQSFLFCGPRGVGKTTCARILAKTINCTNLQPDGEACNVCESCRSFNDNASFNIHEIDAASNNSVEDIRSLTEQVRYAPQSGKYKVYIIDEVHMLSASAFNAFLKTLEEPPSYVKFILATTEKHKILPTILSRCQIFDFNRIGIPDMVKQLRKICEKEGVQCEEEALHLIAQKADGALRDALSIYDRITSFSGKQITAKDVIENLNILDYDYYFRISEALMTEDISACLLLFNEILSNGFEGDMFINGLADHFRNLLVCGDVETLALLEVSESVLERYKTQAALMLPGFLLSGLDILNTADIQYRTSKNKRLHTELTLMKLCYIHRTVSTLQTQEKKTPELTRETPVKEDGAAYILSNARTLQEKKPPETKQVHEKKEETVRIPKRDELTEKIHRPEAPDPADETAPEEGEALPVQPDLFLMCWNQYAGQIRESHHRVAIIMNNAELTFGEKNIVEIGVDSQMEIEILKELLTELRGFMAKGLGNNRFTMEFKVHSREERTKRPYTNMEKYKKMEEKNPLIRELKDTLGLELDY